MFIKLNRSGSRVYAQLAEAFRDEAGNPRNRVIATLGRVDKDDPNINYPEFVTYFDKSLIRLKAPMIYKTTNRVRVDDRCC